MRLLLLSLVFIVNIANAETFVAHCRDRAPELVPTADGGCEGPIAEIIEVAVGKLGHNVDWKTAPWARTIKVAETGGVDIVPRHSMNEERKAFLHPTLYGYQTRNVYYVISPKSTVEIKSMDDLSGLKIGALRGSYYSKNFNENNALTKKLYKDTDQIVQVLGAGRVDVAITSSSHGIDQLMAIPGVRKAEYIDTFYNGRFISIPKQSSMAKYHPEFIKVVNDMRTNGEIDSIFEKYNLKPLVQSQN
ncbi:transporter substrate-binding domain-containing protein [Vibrio sp. S4M6]|uniref:substrate-binding periplasmic protein n=1 Tax=Vibrio sinus TaxID=2946865 RepID=UPI002029F198|nr:transporter substrate-binding domain-containing protein [Vibrio sinus]MCL9780683.1 transporter substrate-binding domain-containing protein [Vibrio sinus]